MMDAWAYINDDVKRSSRQTFEHLYNSEGASSRFVKYFNTIDNRANFFGASNMYEKHMGSGAKWFDGAEYVSRAPITGLGADEKASYLTFGAGKVLGNPDIYGWRKEAGDTLITKGFDNFKDLYNNRPDAMKWDIKQLQDEQKLLQPIHEKYLSGKGTFTWVSEKLTSNFRINRLILNEKQIQNKWY
ncbi:hemagglutinin [Paralysiella testudinis]|uniref:hemagglutinin n=1 Tax=Paralysiella testudinis TaxID=2809020 RepID=UPI001E40C3E0|nr:hemagglutinin [Paralysiella testudinis]